MTAIIVVTIVFIVFGIIFSTGKGAFLIAGYNTKSDEEKEKYDEVALSKFMGKMMFALAFSMVCWALSEAYQLMWLFVMGLVLFIGILVITIFYVNVGNRFMK
ncbi:DUF3784 domain-containing protein [Bacillus sp. AK128]